MMKINFWLTFTLLICCTSPLTAENNEGKKMDKTEALEKLQSIEQEHLLQFYETLTLSEKESLLEQIDQIDIATFKKQQALLINEEKFIDEEFEPVSHVFHADEIDDTLGKKLLSEGKLGCLIVAGGQGSRLQYDGPKGTFPVSPVKKKSLFQIFAEKTLAAGKKYGQTLQLAIMTSEENDQQIKEFFQHNHYFGLNPEQISFFTQKSLPILSPEGKLFLENRHTISKGPDGNGNSLKLFYLSGIFDDWKRKSIEFVNYILIDNPLADPFDAKLLAFQARQKAEIVIKCVKRETAEESVGVLVQKARHLNVVEYSEMSDEQRFAKDEIGNLKFMFANISLFCFTMDFIKDSSLIADKIPMHKAFKKVTYLSENHESIKPLAPNGWKFETFIFDVLPFAKRIELLENCRKHCFSPLKNFEGKYSLKTVQKEMMLLDYETICNITGRQDPILEPFEISMGFYYPTDELLAKWKNKKIVETNYIDE